MGTSFWHQSTEELLKELKTKRTGLSQQEAADRLKQHGANLLKVPGDILILYLLTASNSPKSSSIKTYIHLSINNL